MILVPLCASAVKKEPARGHRLLPRLWPMIKYPLSAHHPTPMKAMAACMQTYLLLPWLFCLSLELFLPRQRSGSVMERFIGLTNSVTSLISCCGHACGAACMLHSRPGIWRSLVLRLPLGVGVTWLPWSGVFGPNSRACLRRLRVVLRPGGLTRSPLALSRVDPLLVPCGTLFPSRL